MHLTQPDDLTHTAETLQLRLESDAIAWAAYSRAWADAMSGLVLFDDGPSIKYQPNGPLDWSE